MECVNTYHFKYRPVLKYACVCCVRFVLINSLIYGIVINLANNLYRAGATKDGTLALLAMNLLCVFYITHNKHGETVRLFSTPNEMTTTL